MANNSYSKSNYILLFFMITSLRMRRISLDKSRTNRFGFSKYFAFLNSQQKLFSSLDVCCQMFLYSLYPQANKKLSEKVPKKHFYNKWLHKDDFGTNISHFHYKN